MQVLGVGLIGYGFLKGKLYSKSDSTTGRRLGLGIAVFYVLAGLALLFAPPKS